MGLHLSRPHPEGIRNRRYWLATDHPVTQPDLDIDNATPTCPHPPRSTNQPGRSISGESGIDQAEGSQHAHNAYHPGLDCVVVESVGLAGLVEKHSLFAFGGSLTE
jgi:hypothetical protein